MDMHVAYQSLQELKPPFPFGPVRPILSGVDAGYFSNDPAYFARLSAEAFCGTDQLRAVFVALIQERILKVQQGCRLEHPVVNNQIIGLIVRDRIVHLIHLLSWFFYCPSREPDGNKKTTRLPEELVVLRNS